MGFWKNLFSKGITPVDGPEGGHGNVQFSEVKIQEMARYEQTQKVAEAAEAKEVREAKAAQKAAEDKVKDENLELLGEIGNDAKLDANYKAAQKAQAGAASPPTNSHNGGIDLELDSSVPKHLEAGAGKTAYPISNPHGSSSQRSRGGDKKWVANSPGDRAASLANKPSGFNK